MVDPDRPAPEHLNPEALRRTRAELQRQVAALDLLLNADRDTLRRTRDDLRRAVGAIDALLAANHHDSDGAPRSSPPPAATDQPGQRRFRPPATVNSAR